MRQSIVVTVLLVLTTIAMGALASPVMAAHTNTINNGGNCNGQAHQAQIPGHINKQGHPTGIPNFPGVTPRFSPGNPHCF